MNGSAQVWGRLFASLKLLGLHLAEAALLRGRLLSIELAQERRRILSLIAWFAATAVFALMAIIMGSFLLIVLFWDSHRVLALGVMTGAYGLLALICVLRLNTILGRLPVILGQTLEVLEKDYRCWANKDSSS